MDSLSNFLEIIINLLGKVPIQVIVLVLNIIVASFTYRRYVSAVKQKNRKIQLTSSKTMFLESVFLALVIFPFVTIYFQFAIFTIGKLASFTNSKIALISLILLQIMSSLFIIWLCINYIRISKDHLRQQNNILMNKIIKIISIYICPIAITIISVFFSAILIIISYDFIDKGFNIANLVAYIFTLIIWSLFLIYSYYSIRIKLQRNVKEVKIFYNQNGNLKVAFSIRYEDFSVNKDFITFYSNNEKCRSVIPAKNLIKIQYFYYE